MSKRVHIWLKKDSEGTYFVYGTYFYNERMGDIPASRKYNKVEKEFKKIEDLNLHKPFKWLKNFAEIQAKSVGLIPDVGEAS